MAERVKRLTLADPRSGTERLHGLLARATSPNKDQNRKWDDDPSTMAKNIAEAENRRYAREGKKRK